MAKQTHWRIDRRLRLWSSLFLSVSLYTVNNEGVYNIKNERILRILPQLLNLTTSETKEFREASSIFELFSTEPAGSCHYVLHLFHSICLKSIVPATKKSEARSYEVLHLPRKVILPDQNATLLSALTSERVWWRDVSGTAPATRHASLQLLFKIFKPPTPAIVFATATKPSRFTHFSLRCRIHSACHRNWRLNFQKRWAWGAFSILTSKCASRHNRNALSERPVCSKCFEPAEFSAFWLRNVLRATTACTLCEHLNCSKWSEPAFFFSILAWKIFFAPHMLRQWSVLTCFDYFFIFTSECASHGSSVHFFHIECPKVLRSWSVLSASRHSHLQCLISHPTRWLRPRRF